MVQSADSASSVDGRHCGRTLLYRAAQRSVLVDSQMRPIFVVIGPVLVEQAPKVLLVENDDVVEQFAAYRTHQALGYSVLPWTLVAGPLGRERQGGCRADHLEKIESRSNSRYLEW